MKNLINKFTTFILALIIIFASTLPADVVSVSAATNSPQSLEELFDAKFYAYKYPDVVSVVGNDESALYKHFVEHGIEEGRTCSPLLNLGQYKANYADISNTYDHHWDDIVKHYFNSGIKEGRQSFVSPEDIAIKNAIDSLEGAETQTNNSIILDSIDSAILGAINSGTGYAQDSKTRIIASAEGYALVPIEMVENEGRIQDIDELVKRCGNDLVLIRDSYNRIKFIGGRFSNVIVKDETSALAALDTMADLYNFDTNRNYLQLSASGTDSLGNPYYRFVSVDIEDGSVNSNYTVTISADKDGNVIGASNSNSSSLEKKFGIKADSKNFAMRNFYENPENGYVKLYDEAQLIYDDETKRYYHAYYYEAAGMVYEVLIDPEKGENVSFTRYYDSETFHNNPSESFNGDYQFKALNSLTEKTFIDFYGNEVKLPVAYIEGKGWYIVDSARKIICVESSKDEVFGEITECSKHYFSDEYFEAVNTYLNDKTASNPLIDNEKTLISAITTIQMSYDENRALGMLAKPKAIYINFKYDDTSDNASHTTYNGAIEFNVYNNGGNADFAGMAHEFGHAVVANQGQNIKYEAAAGAINESYADIIGNLLKMIKKKEGMYSGHVNFERWLIGEFLGDDSDHVIRDMSNPYLNKDTGPSPTKINDKYFVKDTGDYSDDHGGVHHNNSILSNICYRMYNEVFADKDAEGKGIPNPEKYRDLLSIWYDSVIYLNNDSTYADVKGYVLQAMMNHGYSTDFVKQTEQIFNDARVDDYKPFDPKLEKEKNYDDSDLAVAARVNAKTGGFNELTNLIEGKIASDDAEFDYEIAYDEYQLAKLNGLTGNELKEYENKLEIAKNALALSENNVKELKSSFNDSQERLKKMVDDKMAIIEKQEKEFKKVSEAKETNPTLESAYRSLRRSLKSNVNSVDEIIDAVEEVATEFKGLDEISEVFSDVWELDVNTIEEDDENLGYPDDFYLEYEDYPEDLDAWDYYDYWDDFWDAYWEDDYDDWYGNFQEWDEDYNYYDENYSDEDYFSDWYNYDDIDYSYPDGDVDLDDAVG